MNKKTVPKISFEDFFKLPPREFKKAIVESNKKQKKILEEYDRRFPEKRDVPVPAPTK